MLLWLAIASVGGGPFVEVTDAHALTASAAVVLDARGDSARAPFLPGAQVVQWTDIRDGWLRTGRLDDDEEALRRYFERRGVRDDRPVLVYGAMADGWGEEGRIWWTLRYLGHARVFILDGGVQRWKAAGLPVVRSAAAAPGARGRLRASRAQRWRVDHEAVFHALGRADVLVLDVRSRAEYDGATPFWSSRGGHIPSARWLNWKTLIGSDGRLLPAEQLRARLREAGVRRGQRVITYCTGGVRSAFVLAALVQAGLSDAANYDGSWWDWSARSTLPVD